MNLRQSASIRELNEHSAHSAAGHCGIAVTDIGETWVEASMPVDHRTRGADGSVNLGTLAILAESVGSLASTISIDRERFICVGQTLQVYHFAGTSSGPIVATARPVEIHRDRHTWQIDIVDADKVSISSATLVTMVLPLDGGESSQSKRAT